MTPLPENEVENKKDEGLIDFDEFLIPEPEEDLVIKEPEKKNGRSNNSKSLHIAVLLYPDNLNHQKALQIVCSKYQCTFILHDKDVFDNEEDEMQKKPHIHVLLHFASQKRASAIAKYLMIEERFVQCVTNRDSFLRYMIHLDEPDKYQYKPEEVHSNRPILFFNALRRSKDKSERFKEVLEFIIQNKKYETFGEILIALIDKGYYDVLGKHSSFIHTVWKEYNEYNLIRDKYQVDVLPL